MLTPLDIKIELLRRGITGGDIGRKLNITRAAVSKTINRSEKKFKGYRIRRIIAELINRPYKEVWGEDNKKAA